MRKALIAVLLFSSCSTMVKVPLNRLDSPELRGEAGKIDGRIDYQGRNEVELSPWAGIQPPTLTTPAVQVPGHRLVANAEVSVWDRVAVTLALPQTRIGAKWQILGATYKDAQKGNIPLAVTTSVAFSHEDGNSNGSSSSWGTVDLHEVIYDLALISGYRINEKWLIYGGPFILWDKIKTSYKPNANSGNIDNDGKLRSFGANLGGEFSFDQGFARAEYAATKTRLGQAYSGRATYGLALGVRF